MAIEAVKKEEDEVIEPESASQLPKPTGYKILIALPEAEEKTAGGIIKAEETIRIEETAAVTGFVLDMGSDCSKGDWIVMRAFSGTRISIHGKEFRLINDDTVEAVVQDPRGIQRA